MRLKRILIPSIGCLFSVALISCDGGGSGSPSDIGETIDKIIVKLPDDPSQAADASGKEDDGSVTANLEEQYASIIFAGINQARAERGLPLLTRDNLVDSLCADHCVYMIGSAVPNGPLNLNHDNAQSRADVMFNVGYKSFGENTGAIRGYRSDQVATEFVNGWINSSKHSAILFGDYTHSGIAIRVNSADNGIFATQIFGKK